MKPRKVNRNIARDHCTQHHAFFWGTSNPRMCMEFANNTQILILNTGNILLSNILGEVIPGLSLSRSRLEEAFNDLFTSDDKVFMSDNRWLWRITRDDSQPCDHLHCLTSLVPETPVWQEVDTVVKGPNYGSGSEMMWSRGRWVSVVQRLTYAFTNQIQQKSTNTIF